MATLSDLGILKRSGGVNVETNESYEEQVWWVKFTDETATSLEAVNAAGLPAWGSALSGTTLYCVNKTASQRDDDHKFFDVTVTFKTLKFTPRQSSTVSTWSVVKSITGVPWEHEIQYDYAGKPCVNVLGEPMNPPITELLYDAKIDISFMTNSTTHYANVTTCLGMVNAGTCTLTIGGQNIYLAPGTTWFSNYSANETTDPDGGKCLAFRYELSYRADGWHEMRPHMSLMKGVISSGTLTQHPDGTIACERIVDNDSQNVSEPRYLYASGSLTIGQPIPPGGTIELADFTVKGTANFTTLLSAIWD